MQKETGRTLAMVVLDQYIFLTDLTGRLSCLLCLRNPVNAILTDTFQPSICCGHKLLMNEIVFVHANNVGKERQITCNKGPPPDSRRGTWQLRLKAGQFVQCLPAVLNGRPIKTHFSSFEPQTVIEMKPN